MQALALKYRPKNYDELIGQENVSRTLSHALDEGRLTHAYLFSGLRGSGKTSSARIFAKALLCDKGPTSNPCEVCPNCKMANEGRHIDIIEMDGASHRKIDDIRDLIEQTKYAPASARYKIFIIDEVHMLTKEAFNALLKTLEEPPSYVKFILATTDPLKLPATVLSRTQHFRFKPIAKNMIVNHLQNILKNENIPYDVDALEVIARCGAGSLRDSITLLDQAIVFSNENVTKDQISAMLGLLDPEKIEEILKIVLKQDRNRAIDIIKEFENYDPETILDELIANLKDKFLSRDPKFSFLMYERFLRILSEAKNMLFIGSDGEFTLAMTMFLMMEAMNLKSIDSVIQNIKETEHSIENIKDKKAVEKVEEIVEQKIVETPKNSPYEMFLNKIYDRDYDVGECFKNDVEFVKFEDNKMFLISKAQGNNQQLLRKASRAIMEVLKSTFNKDTKIEITPEKKNHKNNLDIDKELEKLKEIQKLEDNLNINHKDKISGLMSELQKSPNSNNESKTQKNIDELKRLFGEPKIIKI